jgi:quercetin dioxygenase-like cupin family protein
MKITNLNQTKNVKMEMEGAKDAFKQVPISRNDGAPLFSFRVFTIEPGGHTPFHKHLFEHVNYIIDGQGVLVSDGGAEKPVTKGDFALVLPDEVHQYRNTAPDKPLVMICAVPKEYE